VRKRKKVASQPERARWAARSTAANWDSGTASSRSSMPRAAEQGPQREPVGRRPALRGGRGHERERTRSTVHVPAISRDRCRRVSGRPATVRAASA
jgi:hypothetical protein